MRIDATIESFNAEMEYARRDDGSTYYRLAKHAPEWMRDAVREAHTGALPYDARYSLIAEIVDAMQGYDGDAMDDAVSEIADSAVDIYTADRIAWLAAHASHMEATDSAREHGYCDSDTPLIDQIAAGQYYLADQVARILWEAIQAESEDDEE